MACVCLYSWLTVTGCWGSALHYSLLIVLFWGVPAFPPHPDERHLAGWQREDWILCVQKCCTKKEIACVQQSRCWERGDWVVLVIGTSPPVLSPFVSRLVVACNHGDSWSCYLLRGRRGGRARDFEAWVTSLCGWSEVWGGRGGTLHKDHTVLFTSIHCLDSQRGKRDQ